MPIRNQEVAMFYPWKPTVYRTNLTRTSEGFSHTSEVLVEREGIYQETWSTRYRKPYVREEAGTLVSPKENWPFALIWSRADVIGLFSINVVPFSSDVVLRDRYT
jgi:hypothetical protein